VSTFLVRQALTSVPEEVLWREFKRLAETTAPKIRRYYQTRDPLSGDLIPVLYFFWVKTVVTPSGENLPLFSRYVFAQDAYPKKKPSAQIICPKCWELLKGRYDASGLDCVKCGHHFNPQQGSADGQYVTDSRGSRFKIKDLVPKESPPAHRMYAILALRPDGEKVYLPVREEDIDLFSEAESLLGKEDLPLPSLAVRPGHNTDQARGYNYFQWKDFFNPRQLLGLGFLLKGILQIEDPIVQEQMLCLFSSTLEFNNLFCSFKGEGTGAVRHMFSNHILKPERTPLENSIWGTNKSSGTFSTLFESRLLRAKRYLDDPFEVTLEIDLFGNSTGSAKVTASQPIRPNLARTWDELTSSAQGALILNGDSAVLPIPDNTIDAVITDPPYFDFVHYSELSDFFFAWLAPVLKDRYHWFARYDSSHQGEVQQKDPRAFASQLCKVLTECRRVLKDDGVLAFSFHHSRSEGWAAIYEAVTNAGFEVVSAHPVHAELRAASPKSAAKNPISLDAILVCRKHRTTRPLRGRDEMLRAIELIVERFVSQGLFISAGDRFVIAAAQMLISASIAECSVKQFEEQLEALRPAVVVPNIGVDLQMQAVP